MNTPLVSDDFKKLSVLLPKPVHKRLKQQVYMQDSTLTEVITDLITAYLDSDDI